MDNNIARIGKWAFTLIVITIALAYVITDMKAYQDLEEEDFNAYIEMMEAREIHSDQIKPKDVGYDSSQKCPYLTSRFHYCTFDNFENNGEAILTEYHAEQGRVKYPPRETRKIYYTKTDSGKLSIKVVNIRK